MVFMEHALYAWHFQQDGAHETHSVPDTIFSKSYGVRETHITCVTLPVTKSYGVHETAVFKIENHLYSGQFERIR